jgi:hypothetical protein
VNLTITHLMYEFKIQPSEIESMNAERFRFYTDRLLEFYKKNSKK